MRITNKSLVANYVSNLRSNLASMQRYQNQMGTGKEILRPSDNPYIATRALGMEVVISRNEQYKRNIEASQGWMEVTDSALRGMTDILNKFKTLTTNAMSVLTSDQSKVAIAEDMKQNISAFAQVGNVTYDGKYIMAGYATETPPFVLDTATNLLGFEASITPHNAAGAINREIAQGVTLDINISAAKLLGTGGVGDNLGLTLQKLYNTVNPGGGTPDFSGPADANSTDFQTQLDYGMKELERHLNRSLESLAENGAKVKRIESSLERNKTENLSMKELLSKVEDVDYAEKAIEFSSRELVYNAALATGARIIQMTLLNYLK